MRVSVQRRWDSMIGEPEPPIVIAYDGSTVSSTSLLRGNTYMFQSTTDCHIAFGETPVATVADCTILFANLPYLFTYRTEGKIAAIKNKAKGTLYITPMLGAREC